MSLQIASINSGSNGNCYYIGNETDAVLVDTGISCRETERRFKRLNLSFNKVKAIFISHEHSDHITGLPALSKKYQIPVYITQPTLAGCRLPVEQHLVKHFGPNQSIQIGGLQITCFAKLHDAADPHSFLIASNTVKVAVITDIGIACAQVIHHFKQCHAAFLEANYDEEMLEKGHYPYHLKKRIRDGEGHLSNTQALALFNEHRAPFLSHLILAHLSKNNNDPELVASLFAPHAGDTEVIVASRYKETELYHISTDKQPVTKPITAKKGQLSLF